MWPICTWILSSECNMTICCKTLPSPFLSRVSFLLCTDYRLLFRLNTAHVFKPRHLRGTKPVPSVFSNQHVEWSSTPLDISREWETKELHAICARRCNNSQERIQWEEVANFKNKPGIDRDNPNHQVPIHTKHKSLMYRYVGKPERNLNRKSHDPLDSVRSSFVVVKTLWFYTQLFIKILWPCYHWQVAQPFTDRDLAPTYRWVDGFGSKTLVSEKTFLTEKYMCKLEEGLN